jgi:predicted MFS family arabinose efflux permease
MLAAFVVVERRRGIRAMMPLALFGTATFVGVTMLTFFLYAALGGLVVLLPYFLIRIAHYGATEAGAAMLPISIIMGLGSRTMGRIAERTGPRLPLIVGPLLVAGGFLLLALRIRPGGIDYPSILLPGLLVLAAGLVTSVAPLTATVMAAVDPDHVGAASGVNNAVARVGGLLATALLGLVLAQQGSDDGFVTGVRLAAAAGGALAAAAALCAALLIRPAEKQSAVAPPAAADGSA